MTELEKAREQIDRIDKEMARLFEERMAAVKTVAEYEKAKRRARGRFIPRGGGYKAKLIAN